MLALDCNKDTSEMPNDKLVVAVLPCPSALLKGRINIANKQQFYLKVSSV